MTDDRASSAVQDLDAISRLALNASREARRSVAALLLELPEPVWREHKGTVETAIAAMYEEIAALRAEVAAVNTQMERMAREMGGQMDLVDQLTTERDRLRVAMEHYADAANWQRSRYDHLRDPLDRFVFVPEDGDDDGYDVARAALAGGTGQVNATCPGHQTASKT